MTCLILATVFAAQPASFASRHYEIRAAGYDPADAAALLEPLHAHLADFFGHEPQGPLPVEFFPNARAFRKALRRDGHPAVRDGGYYAPENRKVYLFIQPSAYFTRHLLLHEATHQFHFLAASGNRKPAASWYTEGIADFFAMHNWSGNRLVCGVVSEISLEDYPARARDELVSRTNQTRWLRRVIAGETKSSRPLSWALVHFLVHRDREAFRRLAVRLDRDEDSGTAFREIFGPVTPQLLEELTRWIADHQQPWTVVWTEWQQSGDALEGWSTTVGLLVHKAPLDRLEAIFEPGDDSWRAGGVFGFRDEGNFHLFELRESGQVRVVRRVGPDWQPIWATELSGSPSAFGMRRRGDRVVLTVGGEELHESPAAGAMGFHVGSCRMRFRVVAAEMDNGD